MQIEKNIVEKFIALPQGNTRYQLCSSPASSSQWVVFVHGMSYPLEVWAPIQQYAARYYQTLSFDLYGRGKSSFLGSILSPTLLMEQIIALLDHCAIQSPVHLVSLSNSDWTLLKMAKDHPHRIQSIGLISPSGLDPRTHNVWMRVFSHFTWLHRLLAKKLIDRICTRMQQHLHQAQSNYESIYTHAQVCVRNNPDFVAAFWAQVANMPTQKQAGNLCANISKEIPFRSFRFAEEYDIDSTSLTVFTLIEHSSIHTFAKGTHMALLENPKQVWEALQSFWQTVEQQENNINVRTNR